MSDTGQTQATSQSEQTFVPPPPRLYGDWQIDWQTVNDYFTDFYNSAVVQSGLLDPAYQATAQTINPSSLPSPDNTTIATAQATANAAYNFCLAINAALGTAGIAGFPLTPPS
jgi:hypothetical protein